MDGKACAVADAAVLSAGYLSDNGHPITVRNARAFRGGHADPELRIADDAAYSGRATGETACDFVQSRVLCGSKFCNAFKRQFPECLFYLSSEPVPWLIAVWLFRPSGFCETSFFRLRIA